MESASRAAHFHSRALRIAQPGLHLPMERSPHFKRARSPGEALASLQPDGDDEALPLDFDSPCLPQPRSRTPPPPQDGAGLIFDSPAAPRSAGSATSPAAAAAAQSSPPLVWNGIVWTSMDGGISQFPEADDAFWGDDEGWDLAGEDCALASSSSQPVAATMDTATDTASAFADRVVALRARAEKRARDAGLGASEGGTPECTGSSQVLPSSSAATHITRQRGGGVALPPAKRPTVLTRAARACKLLTISVISMALRGTSDNGTSHSLSQCRFPTTGPRGKVACWSHAWRLVAQRGETAGEEGSWAEQYAKLSADDFHSSAFTAADLHFVAKRDWFMQSLTQEERSKWVFALLFDKYYADVNPTTQRVEGTPRMHYFVHDQEVCRHTFLLAYPIDSNTLGRLVKRIKQGARHAFEKEEMGARQRPPNDAELELDVAAWLYNWAEDNGEELPGKEHWGRLYVPRTDVADLHRQIEEEFKEVEGVFPKLPSYRMVLRVWNEHPTLKHVRVAKDKRNFQGCSRCTTLRVAIRRAARSGSRAELLAARAELAAHKKLQKDQRQLYYKRRWMARQSEAGCLSIIFDKWNSQTTTVPYFMRAPVDVWKTLKKQVLGMHVLLVMVHGRPNSNYFYYMNGAIRGDANFNVEGIRRSLLAHADGGALPETLYAQMDRAGDNLNYTMLGFFGVLVLWNMLGQVFLSCLVVSHTHEDVDQTFSVGARFMYKAMGMLLSVFEFFDAMMQAYKELRIALRA